MKRSGEGGGEGGREGGREEGGREEGGRRGREESEKSEGSEEGESSAHLMMTHLACQVDISAYPHQHRRTCPRTRGHALDMHVAVWLRKKEINNRTLPFL